MEGRRMGCGSKRMKKVNREFEMKPEGSGSQRNSQVEATTAMLDTCIQPRSTWDHLQLEVYTRAIPELLICYCCTLETQYIIAIENMAVISFDFIQSKLLFTPDNHTFDLMPTSDINQRQISHPNLH